MGLHKEPEMPGDVLTSFNEGHEIIFEPGEHTYHYGKKRLRSATTWIEDYISTFDSEAISARCAEKWDVDQQHILNVWESNGDIAAGFGTAIHAVLEHYYTYEHIGGIMQEASGKEKNAAMPNHPFLKQLIEELNVIREPGELSYQEALVSAVDLGVCGLIDDLMIIDAQEKICRVRDYKITVDITKPKETLAEPFTFMGDTKLAKNFLQLSFYSYLLTRSGWTVEGVDIYNWIGDWHHYQFDGADFKKAMVLVGSKLES